MLENIGNIAEDANSSHTGMVRLVYKKLRDIRQQRHLLNAEVPHPVFRELGKDLQHSVSVCRKAKDFLEMAMEGVLKEPNVIAQAENESKQSNVIAQAEDESPQSPLSAKAASTWCELLDFLQAPAPKARHSCYGRSLSAASLGSKNSLICSGTASSTYQRSLSTPFLASQNSSE